MTTCTKCEKDKDDSEFRKTVNRGKPYTYKHCNDCQREYVRGHYKANTAAYVKKAKVRNDRVQGELREMIRKHFKENPCVDCGEEDLRVLQFDHRDPVLKIKTISDMVKNSTSALTVQAEIDKCDVRCANCHLKRTGEQFGWWWTK